MTLTEGLSVVMLGVTLGGIIFAVGKAFMRLKSQGAMIVAARLHCTDFTQNCVMKQEAHHEDLRNRIDKVKEDMAEVKINVGKIASDVDWLVRYSRKNGGDP